MKDLKELSRPLKAEEIEFRIGSVFKSKKGSFATILAYQEARTPMKVLDEVVGVGGWSVSFREEKNTIVSIIGIRVPDGMGKSEWVFKESNGTAGDIEKEKSAYSDAFKRAAVMWGIGRGLYDFPEIFIKLTEEEFIDGDKIKATSKLRPQDWKWTVEYNADNSVKKILAEQKITGDKPRTEIRFSYGK